MASVFRGFATLRRATPQLSQEFFTCRTLLQRTRHGSPLPSTFFQAFRHQTSQTISQTSTPLSSPAIASNIKANRSFPKTSDKIVAYWLLGSAASVFGIVVFGGLTRLTESGYEHSLYFNIIC